jgi:hypothetical protein
MVWLSSNCGSNQYNLYFDIRDVDLKYQNGIISGVVSGLVGNGVCENWGEVFLGTNESVRILPYWDGTGEIEQLTDYLDEEVLRDQLIYEAKTYLKRSDIISSLNLVVQQQQESLALSCRDEKLAA